MLDEKQKEVEKLTVRAPIDGVVSGGPGQTGSDAAAEGQLPMWSGGALNPKNLGAMLRASDQICQVGDPSNLVAEVIIDQSDVDLVVAVDVGTATRRASPEFLLTLMLDSLPGRCFTVNSNALPWRN